MQWCPPGYFRDYKWWGSESWREVWRIPYSAPDEKVVFPRVKQTPHPILHVWRYIFETCMVHPVIGSILGKRKVLEVHPANVFVKVE